MGSVQLIIDFDSTFTQKEALDELAKIALEGDPDRDSVVAEIQRITRLGMEGKMSYAEALGQRLHLLKAHRKHLNTLIKTLRQHISPSIAKHKRFFRRYADNLYIISGGFHEFVWPIVEAFGVHQSHVLANRFLFDFSGNIVGCDTEHPLSRDQGKVEVVKGLNLNGEVIIVGDGYTDYEIRKAKAADRFICFTETAYREPVAKVADAVAQDFTEVLKITGLLTNGEPEEKGEKALLLEGIHGDAAHFLESRGYIVELLPHALDEDTLIEKLQDVEVLGVRSKTQVSKRVLEAAPNLLAVAAFCIGTTQIDLEACTDLGLAVFNAPFSNTRSVVELAIGEIIMLERGIFDKSQQLHQGIWEKTAKNSVEVRGKSLGIIGYGNIGSQLSVLAEALGLHVYFYDTQERLPLGNARRCSTLKQLLESSDIVSVHVDDSPSNRNLIGKKQFEQMRDGVVFVNLSRGFVVDLDALAEATKKGKIRGSALDVFPVEPKGRHEKLKAPVQGLPNTILTPHIGGSTLEAQHHIAEFVTSRVVDYMTNGSTLTCVNLPNLQLPAINQTHRLLHIHQNVPGMVAKVSGCLAKHGVNIEGQYLKTNEKIGYVIIDVDANYDPVVLEEIKQIPNTKKVRVLY